jgi:hypothetical protein
VEVQQTCPWEQKGFEWWVAPLEKSKMKRKVKIKDTRAN